MCMQANPTWVGSNTGSGDEIKRLLGTGTVRTSSFELG